MIKLNKLLIENDTYPEYVPSNNFKDITSEISIEDAISQIKNVYNEIPKAYCFKRIQKSSTSILYIDTPSLKRTSLQAYNYYTTLLSDILPSWKHYPKRNTSLICSAGDYPHERYGKLYIVYFLDKNPKMGVCPSHDIWSSFSSLQLQMFNYGLHYIETQYGINNSNAIENIYEICDVFDSMSLEDYQKILSNTDNTPLNYEKRNLIELLNRSFKDFIYTKDKTNIKFIDYLNKRMSPKTNGFKLITDYYKLKQYNGNEIWTTSPAIMIPYLLYNDFVNSSKKT